MNRKRGRPRREVVPTKQNQSRNIEVSTCAGIKDWNPTSKTNSRELLEENCIFCGNLLLGQDSRPGRKWDSTHKNHVLALCKALKLNLEDHNLSWDYKNEIYPFCQECNPLVNTIGSFYQQLENIQSEIVLNIQHAKAIIKKTNASSFPSCRPQRPKSMRIQLRRNFKSSNNGAFNKPYERMQLLRHAVLLFEVNSVGEVENQSPNSSRFEETIEIKQEISDSDIDSMVPHCHYSGSEEDDEGFDHSVNPDTEIKDEEQSVCSSETEEVEEFQLFIQEQMKKQQRCANSSSPSKLMPVPNISTTTEPPNVDESVVFRSFIEEQMQVPKYKITNAPNHLILSIPIQTEGNARNLIPATNSRNEICKSSKLLSEQFEFENFLLERVEKFTDDRFLKPSTSTSVLADTIEDRDLGSDDCDFTSFINDQLMKTMPKSKI